jgi:hypothetical protein
MFEKSFVTNEKFKKVLGHYPIFYCYIALVRKIVEMYFIAYNNEHYYWDFLRKQITYLHVGQFEKSLILYIELIRCTQNRM